MYELKENFQYFTNSEQTIYLISKNGDLFEYSHYFDIFKKTKIKLNLDDKGTFHYFPTFFLKLNGGVLLFHSLSTLNIIHGMIQSKYKVTQNGNAIHEEYTFHEFENESYCYNEKKNLHFYLFGAGKDGKCTSTISYTEIVINKDVKENKFVLKNSNFFDVKEIPKRQSKLNNDMIRTIINICER
jgi:hypothetical protein